MPKSKPDVRFITTIKSESIGDPYLIFGAEVGVMEGHELCFPQYRDDPGVELVDLTVRAQMDSHSTAFYGWGATFKPYSVNLAKAESMVKVLRSIDKRLAALSERYGYEQDLAAYMARLAEAVGATESMSFARRVKGEQDMNGTGYRWMNTDYLRSWIDTEVKAWRVQRGLVAA